VRSVAELKVLARKFEPADIGKIRLDQDAKLGASLEYLLLQWREKDWMAFVGAGDKGNWQRGHTARDVEESLIRLGARSGKLDGRGLVVEVGSRRLAELAAKSSPSVCDALKHLEAEGRLEILPAADKAKPRRYRLLVPRAALCTLGCPLPKRPPRSVALLFCKGLRPPTASRLRWSSPARTGALVRRVEGATGRTVTEAVGENVFVEPGYRPYAKRLGPHRGAVLDTLEAAGGELRFVDLCRALHRDKARPRDVRRRILEPLEKAGIIECEGDVMRLAAEWLARLDERCDADGETEQAERQRKRHRRDRDDYRAFLKLQKHGTPAESLEAVRRSRELRERRILEAREEEERRRAPVHPALAALVARLVEQNGRIRMGLLCGIASDEGLRGHDIPRAVEELGCRVEALPEYGGERFVFPPAEEVA
jgi:hypothetical protein